ncbi:MAG: NAD(P)/FAD-dependent oxidoreductase, partial [Gammaproteobacteria bacterium]
CAIAPREDATRRFNQAIRDAMPGTVWLSGCQSWYLDDNGNPAMWPWTFARFRADMAVPTPGEYDIRPLRTATTAVA